VEQQDQLIGVELQQLFQIHTPVRELPEGPLLGYFGVSHDERTARKSLPGAEKGPKQGGRVAKLGGGQAPLTAEKLGWPGTKFQGMQNVQLLYYSISPVKVQVCS